jgi:drug/metabolite transporter (DMT)-like permease
MKNIFIGILLGCIAGIIDVIPMIMQKLTWDANISAFCLWAVSGFLIATSSLQMSAPFKGILISFLVLLPCFILIVWKDIKSIIPIMIMTLVLGSLLGMAINRFAN